MHFFLQYKTVSFIALGAVVLSITGVEALYADMGHFGKLPIRVAWFSVVLPSLVLNYFGQGALLLKHPEAIKNPFFLLAPEWALIPMLIIATLATVIASQAVISGVFSLTRQAVRLGYLSPMRIIHTSEMESGQIYIPFINWLLYVSVVIVIVSFEHSSNLAAAYGIAVTGTMVLTSILSATVARKNWHWNKLFVGLMLVAFLCIDIPLFRRTSIRLSPAVGCRCPGAGDVHGDDHLEERAFPPAAPNARAWQFAGSDDLFAGEVTAGACAGYRGVYVPRPERDPVCPVA